MAYRECHNGGDVSLHRTMDGRWRVLEMIADVSFERIHRFWLTAVIDYFTC